MPALGLGAAIEVIGTDSRYVRIAVLAKNPTPYGRALETARIACNDTVNDLNR